MANCAKTILSITAVVGLLIFILSLTMFFIFPQLVAKKVKQQLPLREGAPVLAKWSKVSVPIYFKIYVFDITNAEEFTSGREEPQVIQRGPFTFFETREKQIDSFSNDSTVIYYNDIKKFYFDPERSNGTLDDEVEVLNVPLMGIVQKLQGLKIKAPTVGSFVLAKANNMIGSTGETLVIRKKVRQLLFEGYHIQLFESVASTFHDFGVEFKSPLPNNTFGAFYNKNGTSPGLYAINTGTEDIMSLGQVQSFRSRPRVPHWSADSCNQINGTDGSSFHPGVKKHETLFLFNVDTCRSLYLKFEKESSVRGIPTYKFSVPDKFFKAPANEPENSCFCTQAEGMTHPLCSTDGLLDISRCKKGAPIVLSAPHFYNGDYKLLENVIGLKPEKQKHETFLEIEPMTGLVLNAARRIQINVNVKNIPDFEVVQKVSDVVMPFIWVEEVAQADEKAASRFKALIQNKLVIGNALMICLMVLGLAIFLVCVLFLYIRRRRDLKLLEALNSSPDIKSSYSSLPTKDAPTC